MESLCFCTFATFFATNFGTPLKLALPAGIRMRRMETKRWAQSAKFSAENSVPTLFFFENGGARREELCMEVVAS